MKYYVLIVISVLSLLSNAQECEAIFLGELKDFHDNTPLVGATVFIKNLNKYRASDENGKFKIENLCKGELTLVISHVGCETKTLTFNITGDLFQSIALEHHIEELNEVSVTSNIDRKETVTAQETVIKEEALQRYSHLSVGDALKEVPGVSSINTGNTIVKPIINGLYGSRLLIMNNSVRLQDQEWGVEHAPNIDINSADRISVIKGSGALAYGGDAIGGVVVINPSKTFLRDSIYGKTIIGAQNNGKGFNLNTVLNKSYESGWFANIQGSFKRNGDFEAPDYMLTNTGLKSNGISLRGGKRAFESGFEVFYSYLYNEIGILRSSHIGNISDLVNAINSQQPQVIEDFSYDINAPKQEVTHHLLKASYYKRFKNFGKLNLQYDYQNNQRFEFDIRVGDDRDKAALDLKLQTHTLQADVKLDSDLNRQFSFGVMGRYQNNFANPDTGIRRLIPDYDKYDFGGYVTTEWNVNDKITLDGGLRYDFNRINAKKFYRTSRWEERGYNNDFEDIIIASVYGSDIVYGVIDPDAPDYLTNPIFNFHNISASAGIKYSLNSNSYLLGNYSLSSRPPNPSELFSDGLHHSAARIELGDLRLDKELSNRLAISYNLNTTNFSLLLEGFYNRISDFIYLRPSGIEQTIRGAFPVWEFQQTQAELYGIDLSSEYIFNDKLSWSNKSSYIKGNDLTMDLDLIDIPALNTINTISYENKDWLNFSANLTSELVFEQKDYPNFNFETYVPTTDETVLVDISTPPPGYHLIHFYSDITFDLSEKSQMNIGLNVTNIFNTNYRAYLNRLRYFADDLGRNITLQIQINY